MTLEGTTFAVACPYRQRPVILLVLLEAQLDGRQFTGLYFGPHPPFRGLGVVEEGTAAGGELRVGFFKCVRLQGVAEIGVLVHTGMIVTVI